MSKKQEFIEYVEAVIRGQEEPLEMTENVRLYWEAFKGKEEAEKPLFTDNGKKILLFLKNTDKELWKAKELADELQISSRSVSGSCRKLVTDGFVEKIGKDPVIYALSSKGKEIIINEGE